MLLLLVVPSTLFHIRFPFLPSPVVVPFFLPFLFSTSSFTFPPFPLFPSLFLPFHVFFSLGYLITKVSKIVVERRVVVVQLLPAELSDR